MCRFIDFLLRLLGGHLSHDGCWRKLNSLLLFRRAVPLMVGVRRCFGNTEDPPNVEMLFNVCLRRFK